MKRPRTKSEISDRALIEAADALFTAGRMIRTAVSRGKPASPSPASSAGGRRKVAKGVSGVTITKINNLAARIDDCWSYSGFTPGRAAVTSQQAVSLLAVIGQELGKVANTRLRAAMGLARRLKQEAQSDADTDEQFDTANQLHAWLIELERDVRRALTPQ